MPYQEVKAYATGKVHAFRVKTIAPILWPKAGPDRPLRLVVIAPVGYRLRAGGKLLYRQPAYLICTKASLSLQQILQYYLWRWDIEVNHRDEKQLIGVGQAQVRSAQSAQRDPGFAVASYAMLLLAGEQTYGRDRPTCQLPRPKWRRPDPTHRLSTQELIAQLRQELWGHELETLELIVPAAGRTDSGHFVAGGSSTTKCPEFLPSLAGAVLYAAGG